MILTKTDIREIDCGNKIIKSRPETYRCPGDRNTVATFKTEILQTFPA